jgi:thiamine biosynthesis lipoprotein
LESVSFGALGTTCELFAVGAPARPLAWGAAWVRAMHARLSRFEPASELSVLNRAAGRWVEVSPDLGALLAAALEAHEASGGLVHAGVLGSLRAIGYTRSLSLGPTPPTLGLAGPLPALPEVLEVRPGAVRLAPGWEIDLGGLAKGWLADRLAPRLGENTLVNLGGDLFARGSGPRGEGWPVAMGGVTVLLRDQGAATSSTRRRRWGEGGRALHHLIDPRTGLPARSDLAEVSVVAETGLVAEVAAKTALLLGSASAPLYLAAAAQGWWTAPSAGRGR